MRFAITGTGRSGTMFLADALGASREVIVRHEHNDDHQGWFQVHGTYNKKGHLALTRERFEAHDNYGEVNSFLRHIIADLPLDLRAVVIRNPLEVALSSINKFPIRWMGGLGFTERCNHLRDDFRAIQHWIEEGYPVWRFERFTKEPDYMAQIVDWIGLSDVQPLKVKYGTKINAGDREFCSQVSELLPAHRRELKDALKWFADIHYPGTWVA